MKWEGINVWYFLQNISQLRTANHLVCGRWAPTGCCHMTIFPMSHFSKVGQILLYAICFKPKCQNWSAFASSLPIATKQAMSWTLPFAFSTLKLIVGPINGTGVHHHESGYSINDYLNKVIQQIHLFFGSNLI